MTLWAFVKKYMINVGQGPPRHKNQFARRSRGRFKKCFFPQNFYYNFKMVEKLKKI